MPFAPSGAEAGAPRRAEERIVAVHEAGDVVALGVVVLHQEPSPLMISVSHDRLAEVVRGFWKSLSKTKTSGSNGAPTCDCGMSSDRPAPDRGCRQRAAAEERLAEAAVGRADGGERQARDAAVEDAAGRRGRPSCRRPSGPRRCRGAAATSCSPTGSCRPTGTSLPACRRLADERRRRRPGSPA